MEQTNKEKVMIRLLRDIRQYQLTTSDLHFIYTNIQRIWMDNFIKQQIVKYNTNKPIYCPDKIE